MASSGMLRRVALVLRATRRNVPDDAILQFHFTLNSISYSVYRGIITG
jgi:hypothetical protein